MEGKMVVKMEMKILNRVKKINLLNYFIEMTLKITDIKPKIILNNY